jgi:hypothetical protein
VSVILEPTGEGWKATICTKDGVLKIFAATKEDALKKIAHFETNPELHTTRSSASRRKKNNDRT